MNNLPNELTSNSAARIKKFSELLNSSNVILFDGSMVTLLYEKGVFINRSFDEINISQGNLLKDIYKEYLQAGAQVLTSNTWGAGKLKLRDYALEDKFYEINKKGAELAREVAEDNAWVAGAMGPLGVRIEPWGPTSFAETRELFKEQAKALLDGGVDLFSLESFADLNEIREAILAIKELGTYPIIAMMTTNEEGQSLYGSSPEWFAQKLDEWGADMIGVNEGNGPMPILEILKRMKTATTKPIILQPNAGLPKLVDGRMMYMASPEYMGEFARQAFIQGAKSVGGYSGTTPQHIKAMQLAQRQSNAFTNNEAHIAQRIHENKEPNLTITPKEQKSSWAKKIFNNEFVVTFELLSTKSLAEIPTLIERAILAKNKGIDAINIPDGPRAQARIGALATSCILEREAQIECVLHYACRDRNLLGMQSDLLGAAALGIKNILAITGDPPKLGTYPNATAVFDIDAIGLVNLIARLNSGKDLGGNSIGTATKFSIGVGANPGAIDLEKEKKRFYYKVEAGAEWVITQPVFDAESMLRFLDFAKKFNIPIIAGIWPLSSLKNAEFMANEVPGVFVPPVILERMRKCKNTEEQKQEGILIAKELIAMIKPYVQGLQISVPGGNVEFALKIIDK